MIESKWLEDWMLSLDAPIPPKPEGPPNIVIREGVLMTLDDDLGVEDDCVKVKTNDN